MADTTMTADLCARARALQGVELDEAAQLLIDAADADRQRLIDARDSLARRLHGNSSDWDASRALRLCNRAITKLGVTDRYDWKTRWARGRKP